MMLAFPSLRTDRRKTHQVHGIKIENANRDESTLIAETHQTLKFQIETAIAQLQLGLEDASSLIERHFQVRATTSRARGMILWLMTRYQEMLAAAQDLKYRVRINNNVEWAGRSKLILPVNDCIRVDFPQFAEAQPGTRAAVIVRHLAQQACANSTDLDEFDLDSCLVPTSNGCEFLVRFAMAVTC